MIINIEWGGFGDKKNFLKQTSVDKMLDFSSINPGSQLFEKMISGKYLGEIARYIILELQENGKIFKDSPTPPPLLTQPYAFESKYLTDIINDKSPNLREVKNFVENTLKIKSSTKEDWKLLQEISQVVGLRAARLSAAAIVAVLSKIDRLQNVTVAVDGSVFEHYPNFKSLMNNTIEELYPQSSVRLVLTKDGSGVGAAIIAATTVHQPLN